MASILRSRVKAPLPREDANESPKLIVISGEGPVTEEIYFKDILATICLPIKDKVRIASVRDEFYELDPSLRTQVDIDNQNKSQPLQVLKRLENYLASEKYINQSKLDDDEYWLVLDIDQHTNQHNIDKWNDVLDECKRKNYKYAVSNPFFEIWLLLHHRDVLDKDKEFEVTDEKHYHSTDYFKTQLKELNVPLTGVGKKEPKIEHYSLDKIKNAIKRAKALNDNDENFENLPKSLGSTVYILAENILSLMP